MMSSTFEDAWLDFSLDTSMLALVCPNDICPIAEPLLEFRPTSLQFENDYSTTQQIDKLEYIEEPITIKQTIPPQDQLQPHQSIEHRLIQEHIEQFDLTQSVVSADYFNQEIQQQDTSEYQHLAIGPPPLLIPNDERKAFNIQEQLDFRRALSQQRQQQLKARLESEPPRLPPRVMRKSSGKKMTGRERQQELERTEARLRQQNSHYMELITKLEAKCSRLREILGNIVTNSPEYNNQMLNCLEQDFNINEIVTLLDGLD